MAEPVAQVGWKQVVTASDASRRGRGDAPARTVLLVHQGEVQHYRVGVYNYMSEFLAERGWHLAVASCGIERGGRTSASFDAYLGPLGIRSISSLTAKLRPSAVILFLNLRELYLFPLIALLKGRGLPVIYWGHAIDLEDREARIKRAAYSLEHALVDALILYGPQLKAFVAPRHAHKTFIANNTLNTRLLTRRYPDKERTLAAYGIRTRRNVICVGRLQQRKRIDQLLAAFKSVDVPDAGLILVGPDADGVAVRACDQRIVWTGPMYGSEVQTLMECADVYCMPGHVGLGIVDAFFFGLPLVTTDVDHAPEIMYLEHGVNGLMMPRDDVAALSGALEWLLRDDARRAEMSAAAESTVRSVADIETMCRGFADALSYVQRERARRY